MNKKHLFLFSSLFTMLILAGFMFISEKTEINSLEDIKNIKDNSIVTTYARVIEENPYPYYTSLKLNNSLQLRCKQCTSHLVGKNLTIKGVIDEYEGKKNILVISYTEK